MTLFNPSLTTLLFYSGNKLAEDSDKRPNLLLANTLGLQPQQGNTDAPLYQGKHSEEILVTLDSCNAHDTFIVRLNL